MISYTGMTYQQALDLVTSLQQRGMVTRGPFIGADPITHRGWCVEACTLAEWIDDHPGAYKVTESGALK